MEILAPTEALRLFAFHLAQEMRPNFGEAETLSLSVKEEDGVFYASAKIRDEVYRRSACIREHFTELRTQNVAYGKALFALFSAHGASPVPYGTLVGVRPVKIAVFYLSRGLSQEQTEKLLGDEYCMHPDKAHLLCRLAAVELATQKSLKADEAMLYLSIPFCPSRCRYCSFVSHSAPQQLATLPAYLKRMTEELKETAEMFAATDRKLRAVYLGGGTPGLLNAEELRLLFETVKSSFSLTEDAEFTAELGRPDTITKEKCEALSALEISRICINPQTLNGEVLHANNRLHSVEEFYRAFELARAAKIPTVNTDLIAGLYRDTPEGFLDSLRSVLQLSPENLTIHALCKKRASSEENEIEDDADCAWSDAMQKAQSDCIKHGYLPYYLYRQKNTIANLENLGYAKNGHACLYNVAMMQDLCDVFSVGAGAMTKIRKKTEDGYQMIRLPSYKYPAEYLKDYEKGRKNRAEALKLSMELRNV